MRENLTLLHANNKSTDQPAHPCSLISDFVLHILECTVKPVLSCHSKMDKTKILMANGSLMKVESIAECSTFDLHQAIIGLEKHFWSSFRVATSDRFYTGPRSAVGNVSGYRCVSDCRSRGREFDPGPVPNFRGD